MSSGKVSRTYDSVIYPWTDGVRARERSNNFGNLYVSMLIKNV